MLQTKRICIRPLNLKDDASLYEYETENRSFLAPFNPIRPESYYTLEGNREKIEQEKINWKDDRSYSFGIFSLGANKLIGRVNLSNIVRGAWQNCTIGYSMAENMQGKGYMTEAVKLALTFAFEQANLHRVQAGVMPQNKGSFKVLHKSGFFYEGLSKYHLQINGRWEDHEIYAITKETWQKQTIC